MPKTIGVHVPFRRNDLLHDLRNLGEEAFHQFRDRGYVSIREVDRAKDHFLVRGIRDAEFDTVVAYLERRIAANGLAGLAVLRTLDEVSPQAGEPAAEADNAL